MSLPRNGTRCSSSLDNPFASDRAVSRGIYLRALTGPKQCAITNVFNLLAEKFLNG